MNFSSISRCAVVLTFNDQLYIGQLNYEIMALESEWMSSLHQRKRLEKKLSDSYAENSNLRDKLYTVL